MSATVMEVKPIAGAIGAEIYGVDLSTELTQETFARVHQAFLDHHVLFFPDQSLTTDQQKAFARRFGPLIVDPFVKSPDGEPEVMEVKKDVHETKNFANMWHSDSTFMVKPPMGSFLYALEVPDFGGDTMWSNQYLAYETLSAGMRAMLDKLKAIHGAKSYNEEVDAGNYNEKRSIKLRFDDVMKAAAGAEVEHPVVRTHPETGRKALYIHVAYVLRFKDWTEAESKPLLDFLYAHSVRPEFTCRYRWRRGTLTMWDNRCAMHYPINDYQGKRRVMRRVTAEGDRPF